MPPVPACLPVPWSPLAPCCRRPSPLPPEVAAWHAEDAYTFANEVRWSMRDRQHHACTRACMCRALAVLAMQHQLQPH